ncbi:MAG TPA: metalloregulator ArsR/SmtB family transcription factor [Gemmatimonadales bacterium]|jgi:DNA-binding transcriptional ArsR family regulator|nr:metalloregulator ArsR/SmtB family transcription factor [Gemmatimonadales bacterium]
MVKYQSRLNNTFGALSHPARRAILARLEREPALSVSALAEPLDMKLPATLKHLDVLLDAKLIRRSKHGRTVTVELAPRPLRDAVEWLHRYERFWAPRLDRLVDYAETSEADEKARGK